MDHENNISNEILPPILEEFLNYFSTIKARSPNTIKAYTYDLTLFLKFMKVRKNLAKDANFDNIDISDVDTNFIESICLNDLYAYLSFVANERSNTPPARARKVASLRSFYNYLYTKSKVISKNPAQELESPKLGIRQPVYLTLDESKKLLDSIEGPFKERDYAIITLFLNCGLRLSELANININDIKDDKLTVIGKGNKQRTVYLNDACINAINEYLKVRPHDSVKDKKALFLSKRLQRISIKTIQYLVKKYLRDANLDGKKYSTHKLRHTAATLMYRYGKVDIRTLQRLLGHSNVSTTQIYTHVDDAQLRDAVYKNPLSEINHDKKN
ncbi:tyrosine recombinase XerC [Thermoanaerobacterium sp. RBIITD]|uniref:tyrosine recombinase XerC n=1 Tax=Thermoanaerobacterium sp. RBIITD TaxID=1550240 RepID=UPI000BB750F0|nr:tyrosine recombinase XerC [Thermoanaerobacterium sp. RBIITD]SNX55439.1 Site-specific recombinase XerD [Thermoanaerobacterium sp. RBIITD]